MASSSSSRSTGASIISKKGYSLKFEIRRVEVTKNRPHGLSYSFTLHAPDGTRLIGFDNAHEVEAKGSPFKRRGETTDHWHRTEDDAGRPYRFKDAETLTDDFFDEVERVLRDRGLAWRSYEQKHHGGRNEAGEGSESASAA